AAGVARALAEEGADALPLAGLVVAVKDNIDAAGFPTTAALPVSAYQPEESATVVARLEAAGAVVLGKTNLDQLATGLVGTRSPYGEVRGAEDPELVSGGSSSGSAVAV
ncbi:allophanate hydrolase, partial [Clavibacter michiganensis subsp. insidiosus]